MLDAIVALPAGGRVSDSDVKAAVVELSAAVVALQGLAPTVESTGWTVMTGTPQKGTFATGSVTLPQLAGVVMAMESALIDAGVLGA